MALLLCIPALKTTCLQYHFIFSTEDFSDRMVLMFRNKMIFLMEWLSNSETTIFPSQSKQIPQGELDNALPHSPSAFPAELPAKVLTIPAVSRYVKKLL